MTELMEEWKPVVGYEMRYEVSDRGAVRSRRYGILKQAITTTGYLIISLRNNGENKTRKVHSLVCEAFIGSRPKGYHVNHIDHNKLNNYLDNLEYLPPRLNNLFASQNAIAMNVGRLHKNRDRRRLTEDEVRQIRVMNATMGSRTIGKIFGIHHETVCRIVRGDSWKGLL